MLPTLRRHPPTLASALAALLGSLAQDLAAFVPALSPDTATLATVVVLGFAGGLIGRASQHWTTPLSEPRLRGPGDHHDGARD